MKSVYTEDDMEMLRNEIRNLTKERSDLQVLLQARGKEMNKMRKELKRARKLAMQLQGQLVQKEVSHRTDEEVAADGGSEYADDDDGGMTAERPQPEFEDTAYPLTESEHTREDAVSAGSRSEQFPRVNSDDLKDAIETLSLDESSTVENAVNDDDNEHAREDDSNRGEEKDAARSTSSQNADASNAPEDADEIRKRAERMLVWANSATNRNEAMAKQHSLGALETASPSVPRTISLTSSTGTPADTETLYSGFSANSSEAGSNKNKRLYRNVPNPKKKGPLSEIRRFLEDQIVGDSREDTYLESDSDSAYYSTESEEEDSQHRTNLMAA